MGFDLRTVAALIAILFLSLRPAGAAENPAGRKGQVLYAHEGINVREGPGLKYGIIGRLAPGDAVEIKGSRGEWGEIRRGRSRGFVLLSLLKEETLPPLQIVNWKWRKAPRIGRRGVVVWVVEVRNNSKLPVPHVRVEFRTFDKRGNPLASATTHLKGIKPGKIAGSRSFAVYSGRESSAEVVLMTEETAYSVGKK